MRHFRGGFSLPLQADLTFLHQKVWDPRSRKIVPLAPYLPGDQPEDFEFAGGFVLCFVVLM